MKGMEDAVRLVESVMASEAHGHILCSDLVLYHESKSLRAAKGKMDDVREDLEGGKEKMSERSRYIAD